MIPKHFHFVFGLKPKPEHFHVIWYVALRSCIAVNAPRCVYFHYQQEPYGDLWDKIKPHLSLVRYEGYEPLSFRKMGYAHRSDFLRLEALNASGGVYADMDTIFLKPLPDRLWSQSFVLGREDIPNPFYGLCNALIMAESRSVFGERWLREMQHTYDGRWNSHSVLLPKALAIQLPDEVCVEPQRSFYRHMWDEDGLSTLFERLDLCIDDSYSFHLWEHVAWRKHLRHMNVQSLLANHTTYSHFATPFLTDS